MQISEIQIDFIKPKSGIIGFASLVLDQNLYLSSIAIHKRLGGGHRLTYPNKGSFTIFHPINKATSRAIEKAVFDQLEKINGGIAQ